MSGPIKHMMEIMSEGYPTTACERLEEAARMERVAERLRDETVGDIRAGRKVCGPCLRSKRANHRFPSAGCPHRRQVEHLKRSRAGMEARRKA